jgi:hypothetical protein
MPVSLSKLTRVGDIQAPKRKGELKYPEVAMEQYDDLFVLNSFYSGHFI